MVDLTSMLFLLRGRLPQKALPALQASQNCLKAVWLWIRGLRPDPLRSGLAARLMGVNDVETTEDDDQFSGLNRLIPLLVMIALMWVIELADRVVAGLDLQSYGIHPRELGGILGIFTAPFLHSDWGHLLANTGGLLILGSLVLIRGLRVWVDTTAAIIVVGGLFTWLVGNSGNHIGASGLVFGYFGFLIGSAIFERSMQAGALALVAIMFYGSIWYGLIPQDGVSWAGHAGGLMAGVLAARVNSRREPAELEAAY